MATVNQKRATTAHAGRGGSPPTLQGSQAERARAKLTSKCQVVIPKLIRERLGLRAGDAVLLRAEEGVLVMVPEPKDWATAWRGLGADVWEGVDVKEYIRQLREDREIEPEGH